MREDMDLIGRRPHEPLLETEVDKNSGEHVFALKDRGKIVAVARLEKFEKPFPCFYLRRIETVRSYEDKGNAAILMQEITDLFNENGDVCIAYQDIYEKTHSLVTGSGWRQLQGTIIWALNLPPEHDKDALNLIAELEEDERL